MLPLLLFPLPVIAQTAGTRFTVTGTVQDQTSAVLPRAEVTLVATQGGESRVAQASDAGVFRFDDVPPGNYELHAQFSGFEPAVVQLRVGPRPPGRLKVVLPVAGLKQEVTVGTDSASLALDAAQNRDAVTVDRQTLGAIPAFDRDLVGTLASLLDPGAAGTGGVTLVVDGMESRKVGVPASAIQQVRINQDAYSAEYARPGQGRVEVITKAGTDAYHGEANLTFRDARLNARNAFATTRPPEQRRIVEGVVSGPIGAGRTTSFMTSVNREETDQQAIVFAIDPSGEIRQTVPVPQRNLELSATMSRQQGKNQLFSLRANYQAESVLNEGPGGTTLPEAASDSHDRELEFIYTHRTILTGHVVNEFRLRVSGDRQTVTSRSPRPGIVVQDAFTAGGAQADQLEEERRFTLNETLSWSRGRHAVRGGLAIPDWSHRRYDDGSNFGGTFSFASLEDYVAGRPFRFVQQQGDGRLAFTQKMLALFVQDTIAVGRSLSVVAGLRYDWQNFFGDGNNVAPRASFAWAPGSRPTLIVRGGAGLFYDRTGVGPMADVLHSSQGRLLRYVLLDPGYPDPLAPGAALQAQPTSLVVLAPGFSFPYTFQFGLGLERQLSKSSTLAVNYTGARGVGLFRSRDVNAPPPPLYLARPDPDHGVVRQIEPTGRSWSQSLQVTLRGKLARRFDGSVQYVLGRARNDTGGIGSFPANDYDLAGEYARADSDQRHRLDLVGTVSAGRGLILGTVFSARSGRPYSLRTGRDEFNNGTTLARPPGVPRNSLEGPGFARLDVRCSRAFALGADKEDGPKLTLGLDAFNVLNRVNLNNYVGNRSSPFFGQPTSAQPARRLQLSGRFEF